MSCCHYIIPFPSLREVFVSQKRWILPVVSEYHRSMFDRRVIREKSDHWRSWCSLRNKHPSECCRANKRIHWPLSWALYANSNLASSAIVESIPVFRVRIWATSTFSEKQLKLPPVSDYRLVTKLDRRRLRWVARWRHRPNRCPSAATAHWCTCRRPRGAFRRGRCASRAGSTGTWGSNRAPSCTTSRTSSRRRRAPTDRRCWSGDSTRGRWRTRRGNTSCPAAVSMETWARIRETAGGPAIWRSGEWSS